MRHHLALPARVTACVNLGGPKRTANWAEGVATMIGVATGWNLEVERGPDWLYVKLLSPSPEADDAPPLAETIWSLLEQHFTYRVILELDQLPRLTSYTVGQLVLLHKRVFQHGGMVRLCGLNAGGQDVLRILRLADRFPQYRDRSEAVMGNRPAAAR